MGCEPDRSARYGPTDGRGDPGEEVVVVRPGMMIRNGDEQVDGHAEEELGDESQAGDQVDKERLLDPTVGFSMRPPVLGDLSGGHRGFGSGRRSRKAASRLSNRNPNPFSVALAGMTRLPLTMMSVTAPRP